jgi:hypothetical protein
MLADWRVERKDDQLKRFSWVGLADLLGVLWLTRRMLITDCLDLAASGGESGDNPPGEARPQRPAGGTHA